VIKLGLDTRIDETALINTSIHRGVGWGGRGSNCFNSFGSARVKPLKRFRVERSDRNTHLKLGVNERVITERLSSLDVESAPSNKSQF